MITIDFNSFWGDQQDVKKTCLEFVESLAGKPDKITILKEVEDDPESSFDIYLHYSKYNLNNFKFYDELMEFANQFELYVVVYDHSIKDQKGYWYDESDVWVRQNFGINEIYTNCIK